MNRHFTVTAYIRNNNKILLMFHTKLNKWLPLGGHMEGSELPEETVLREVQEESGITDLTFDTLSTELGMIQPLGLQRNIIKADHEHLDLIYSLNTKQATFKLNEQEGKDMRWFSKKEIEDLDLFPLTRMWINKILN